MIARCIPVAVGWLAVASSASAEERVLRPGRPAEVGISAARLERAAAILDEETKSGRVGVASLLVARRGRVVLHRSWGRPVAGAPPRPDTVFGIASITKPATVAALMRLVEEGKVSLADPVQKHLPEFKGAGREKVRVEDLLTHVSGLPDMLPENDELRKRRAPLEAFVERALTTPLLFAPRTSFAYQSMGILLAAVIVERVGGLPLREALKRDFFDPLGMKQSSLGLGGRSLDTMAPSQGGGSYASQEASRREYLAYWSAMGVPWGGMHSTTGDLAILLQTFLNGGVYGGKRVLSPATVRKMITNRNPPPLEPWGLGWKLNLPQPQRWFGDLASPETFGHTGSSGTLAWADPAAELICVILTTRPRDADGGSLLSRLSNAVQAAVVQGR